MWIQPFCRFIVVVYLICLLAMRTIARVHQKLEDPCPPELALFIDNRCTFFVGTDPSIVKFDMQDQTELLRKPTTE